MHSKAFTTANTIRILAPYGEEHFDYKRSHRLPVREDVRKAVYNALVEMARTNPEVWWNRTPYYVSVCPSDDTTRRGEYVWSVNRWSDTPVVRKMDTMEFLATRIA